MLAAPCLGSPLPRTECGVHCQEHSSMQRQAVDDHFQTPVVSSHRHPQVHVSHKPIRSLICVSSSKCVYMCVKLRVHFGSILGPFWVHFGSILGPFWVHFGSILGPFWVHPFRVHFGSILGPFWVHFGSIGWSILGPFGVHLGSILGPFCLLSEW